VTRVLLLGANGKLGQMVRYFWPKTDELITLARNAQADIVWSIDQNMDAFPKADVVLALWGQTKVTQESLNENADLAAAAQRIGQKVGAKMVIHASTAAVYRPTRTPSRESDLPSPQNLYGQSKVMMEQSPALGDGPSAVVLRIGNVIGADGLFNAIRAGGAIVLDTFEDGKGPLRSYVTPDFLTDALWRLSQMHPQDIKSPLNISQRPDLWMEDILQALGQSYTMREAPKGANQYACLDSTCLYSLLDLSQDEKTVQDLLAPWLEFDTR